MSCVDEGDTGGLGCGCHRSSLPASFSVGSPGVLVPAFGPRHGIHLCGWRDGTVLRAWNLPQSRRESREKGRVVEEGSCPIS